MSNDELAKLLRNFEPPAIVADAGSVATYAHAEFFSAQIRSPNTRKAYRRAVDRFLAWCDDRNLGFQEISSPVISEYLDHHLVKDSGQLMGDD